MFWQLIARLGCDLQPARLAMALSSLSGHHFLAFGWHLRRAANQLDGPTHRYFASDAREHELPCAGPVETPYEERVVPGLREVQMTVVALGRDTWSAVVAVPVLLEASWPCALGRQVEALTVSEQRGRDGVLWGA